MVWLTLGNLLVWPTSYIIIQENRVLEMICVVQ